MMNSKAALIERIKTLKPLSIKKGYDYPMEDPLEDPKSVAEEELRLFVVELTSFILDN